MTRYGNEWVFTFGAGQPLEGFCVRIKGDYYQARKKMVELFGVEWAFQYSAKEWEGLRTGPLRLWIETELTVEEALELIKEIKEKKMSNYKVEPVEMWAVMTQDGVILEMCEDQDEALRVMHDYEDEDTVDG